MVKVNGMLTRASYMGLNARYNMPEVEIDGRRLPRRVFQILDETGAPAAQQLSLDTRSTEASVAAPVVNVNTPPQPPINVRFSYLKELVSMVAVSVPTSLVITGSGGLGKSYTVFTTLRSHSLEENVDFIVCRGTATPKAMYRLLYENRDKIVVFDDCDSVLENPTAVMLLKAALDSTSTRTVCWMSEARGDDETGLPNSFTFEGKIIFISNKPVTKIPQPILSRALFVDVTMTAPEKIDRMRAIAEQVKPEMPIADKHEVINLLDELKDQTADLNIRTMTKVLDLKVASPTLWKDIARYIITSN